MEFSIQQLTHYKFTAQLTAHKLSHADMSQKTKHLQKKAQYWLLPCPCYAVHIPSHKPVKPETNTKIGNWKRKKQPTAKNHHIKASFTIFTVSIATVIGLHCILNTYH